MPLFLRIAKRAHKSFRWFQGWLMAHVALPFHKLTHLPIRDISAFQRFIPFIERREYSQNGEDGIIHAIFAMIGTTNRYAVEFGVEDGVQSNTRYLVKKKGWQALWMDGGVYPSETNVKTEFITAENIEDLFRKHGVPERLDLLSIDIDGNDYWVWKAIEHYRPRVVIVEYNAHIPPEKSLTIPYRPDFAWDKTDYYGASLLALKQLGEEKGYTLIGTDRNGVNAFFVETGLARATFEPPAWPKMFHPPSFKGKPGLGHPKDPLGRPWVIV